MKDYSALTIMFCLPRTRSQWWAWFFARGLGPWSMHDRMAHHASPASFVRECKANLETNDRVFIADTGAIFFHDYLVKHLPGMRAIYAFRNPEDVIESLRKQTGHNMRSMIEAQNQRLYQRAYQEHNTVRLHWGCVSLDMLRNLWTLVTGLPVPNDDTLRAFNDHIVDVPVLQQFSDKELSKSLWGYRE